MLSDETRSQIDTLNLTTGRPLIICDVDEVVVHFIAGLENFLQKQGLWLDTASFALNGNIKKQSSGEPVDKQSVSQLLSRFFNECSRSLQLIDGAAMALHYLADAASVVFLTNIPHANYHHRRDNLDTHGLTFPLITNTGSKGPAIAKIAAMADAPVFFIDDIPNFLSAAAQHYPPINLVHFTQDRRFSRHLPPLEIKHFRCESWAAITAHIAPQLGLAAP